MSFWFYRKDKDGKKMLTSVSVPLPLVMPFIALFFAVFGPFLFSDDLRAKATRFTILVVIGFLSFVASKVPQFRRGEWFTWGMRYMGIGTKTLYVLGYVLMALGILGVLALYRGTA